MPAHESMQHTIQQKQCTTMMAADSHTTRRKHQRQPNTPRPLWGADPPQGHCTHAQPPPPTNGARAQESQAGPGGSDSAPPMGGRPCPSASEVTRTRPPREERPCPGSRGRRASWRQRSAQRGGSIAHNATLQAKAGRGTQCNSPAHNSTQQHTTTEEQSKVVYHNNSGGQPHHPPRTPTPAKHPTPRVGTKPTTRALHPHPATAAHKQGTHREHHQEPKTPHPNANTAPTTHATTKATLTHNIEGMLP